MKPIDTYRLAENWGANLKASRNDCGLTQLQLAELAGISEFTISRLENGWHLPSESVKFAIAEALGVSAHQLFSLDDLEVG